MTRDMANKYASAVLTSMYEAAPHSVVGESILYLGTGLDLSTWQWLRGVMEACELLTMDEGHGVQLTDKGRAMAVNCLAVAQ